MPAFYRDVGVRIFALLSFILPVISFAECRGGRMAQHYILQDAQSRIPGELNQLVQMGVLPAHTDVDKLIKEIGKVVGPRPTSRRRIRPEPIQEKVILSRFAENGALETHELKIKLSGCKVMKVALEPLLAKIYPEMVRLEGTTKTQGSNARKPGRRGRAY